MASTAQSSQKLKLDKTTAGNISFLELHGVVDDGFDGKNVAELAREKKLVLALRDVRRFASWGMAEWMTFLRETADRDLYFVECSTYAVHQMNLVTGLLGHGKLVSFYSSYRCASCGEEFELMTLVPRDRATLRTLDTSEQPCTTCGGVARIDKSTVATSLADLPAFDLDDEVIQFLRERFAYDLSPDITRFRAQRLAQKDATYLRLSGNAATLPAEQLAKAAEGTTLVDLAGITFDPEELAAWRLFLRTALPLVPSLQLIDCPPGFLEVAVAPTEPSPKLAVRSFAVAYPCATCNAATAQMIDVAANLEQLTEGILPSATCATCKAALVAPVSDALAAVLRRLPARAKDLALERFLAKARGSSAKLEDALALKPTPAPTSQLRRVLWVALALGVVLAGGIAAVGVKLWRQPSPTVVAAGAPVTAPAPATFKRPDWIISDVPSSSFCQDMLNRLVCVGVSSYRATRDAAVAEANDAALDELVNSIGLKITDPFFKENVLPGYSAARSKALSALQAVEVDRASPAYAAAADTVRKARARVVEILRAVGGAAVPAQRSDWYWEEYAKEKGSGDEQLVFIRYDISADALKTLVEKFSETVESPALDAAATTSYPGLAWELPDFTGGAQLHKAGPQLEKAGVSPPMIVTSVGDQPTPDAATFARRVDEVTGPIQLAVRAADGATPARTIEVQR